MTAATLTRTTIDPPDLPGFDTHYGVRLSYIGDDGDIAILGHPHRRRALAAVRALLREGLGLRESHETVAEHLRVCGGPDGSLDRVFARVREHCDRWPACEAPAQECDSDSPSCADLAAQDWWLDIAPAGVADAFPVTYWRA